MSKKRSGGETDKSSTDLTETPEKKRPGGKSKSQIDRADVPIDEEQSATQAEPVASVPDEPKPDNAASSKGPDEDEVLDAVDVTEASSAPSETEATMEETARADAGPPYMSQRTDPRRRGGAAPLIVGGIVAAVLGFMAARADLVDPLLPAGWRAPDLSTVAPRVEQLEGDIQAIRSEVAGIEIPEAGPPPKDFGGAIEAIEQTLNDLNDRVTQLENRPAISSGGVDNAALEDLDRQLAKQQATIEELVANVKAAEAAAFAKAQKALARAAVMRLMSAIETGSSFDEALDEFEAASDIDVPAVLHNSSTTGVATLGELQEEFPNASRAALAATRGGDTTERSIGGYLRRQLAVRSVVPRDGDDPDAVLSRIEAAVRDGRLSDALSEVERLPADAQAAMSDWLERARLRRDVSDAAAALFQQQSSI